MLDISKPDTKVIIKGGISDIKKVVSLIDSFNYKAPSGRTLLEVIPHLAAGGREIQHIRLKPNFKFTFLEVGTTSTVTAEENEKYADYTVEEFIQATQKLLTPEEILVTFLKHHRKFASFKRGFATRSSVLPLTLPMVQSIHKAFTWDFGWWQKLDTPWRNLCKQFDIENTPLDYTKIKGLKYER